MDGVGRRHTSLASVEERGRNITEWTPATEVQLARGRFLPFQVGYGKYSFSPWNEHGSPVLCVRILDTNISISLKLNGSVLSRLLGPGRQLSEMLSVVSTSNRTRVLVSLRIIPRFFSLNSRRVTSLLLPGQESSRFELTNPAAHQIS